jgi:hypothetical protein
MHTPSKIENAPSLRKPSQSPSFEVIPIRNAHDPQEREAEALADGFWRPQVSSSPLTQSSTRRLREDDVGWISRTVLDIPPHGFPVPAPIQKWLAPRLGTDLSDVRLHVGPRAHDSAKRVRARAFTLGTDIVFASGEYNPGSSSGRRLLTHELTHVAQERRVASTTPALRRSPGSPAGGCGICFGSPREAGKVAHELIQNAFRSLYGASVVTEFPLLPSAMDDNGRLDLAVFTGDNKVGIGEIKPNNIAGYLQGDLDLFWYEQQLTRLGFSVGRLRLPPPLPGISFIDPRSPGCSQTMYVEPPVHGIYSYSCEPDFKELRLRCKCEDDERVRIRVPVPESARKRIYDWARSVVKSGEDVSVAADRFIRQNRDLVNFILYGGTGVIVLLLLDDLGGGIADDILIPIILALQRAAWQYR